MGLAQVFSPEGLHDCIKGEIGEIQFCELIVPFINLQQEREKERFLEKVKRV